MTARSDPGPAPKVARYARGDDYHRVTRERMEPLADLLRSRGATIAHTFADSGPVPERALALRAGLGWIGKNTMLIRPGAGSFFFIGTVFTDLALDRDVSVTTDHCGSCTRCLDACPTGALVEPRILDATRCISYLTIEQKRPIPAADSGADGGLGVRLRHLQRGVPLEPAVRRAERGAGVRLRGTGWPARGPNTSSGWTTRSSPAGSANRRSSAPGSRGYAAELPRRFRRRGVRAGRGGAVKSLRRAWHAA